MSELHFSIEGEFITNIARSWFWDEDKPYEKSEELLMSCMCGGSDTEKRIACQDIIEGRKKLVGINEFELVDDNKNVRPISKKIEELRRKLLRDKIQDDMIANPLNYVDRFSMTTPYKMLVKGIEKGWIDGSYDGIINYIGQKEQETDDLFYGGTWLLSRPDLIVELNGAPLPPQVDSAEFYASDFWEKLSDWIDRNLKGKKVERRQNLYKRFVNKDRNDDNEFLSKYGLISPDGKWYNCEFGGHTAIAGRIIQEKQKEFNLTDNQILDMMYDCYGKALDYLYKKGWIAIRNPSMGDTFIDMDETKRATKAQTNVIFDYISHFNRYDMSVSKIMD